MWIGIGNRLRHPWMHHRETIRPGRAGAIIMPFVMVADDQIDAALAGNGSGGDGGYAAIYGHDKSSAIITNLFDRLGIQPVSLFNSMRDVVIHLPAQIA